MMHLLQITQLRLLGFFLASKKVKKDNYFEQFKTIKEKRDERNKEILSISRG